MYNVNIFVDIHDFSIFKCLIFNCSDAICSLQDEKILADVMQETITK